MVLNFEPNTKFYFAVLPLTLHMYGLNAWHNAVIFLFPFVQHRQKLYK
jgi:hypothetical protein